MSANPNTTTEVEPRPQLPGGRRDSYACRGCRKVLSRAQWVTEGCRECGMVASAHDLNDVATKNYINYIGIIDAERSWVARVIQKPPTCPDGVYAEALSDEDEFDEEEEGADEFSRGVEVGPGREGSEDANAIESRYM